MTFRPRLDVLPTAQRRLWPTLADVPEPFVLYGGTALALRLAHRTSVDFDFAAKPLDADELSADGARQSFDSHTLHQVR